ncbi:MAG: disulfide bond formation protein B [Rhodospirillaceae bacterium]|nr:MAG: disulfide bond formation protein B [Rhodospirillaceae bacterium]
MPAARSRFIETPAITWLVTGGALAALCIAWLAQYAGGLAPCELCYLQRYGYWTVIVLGIVTITQNDRPQRRGWLLVLMGLALLVVAGIAVFHVGVEQKWWEGSTACVGASTAGDTTEELTEAIMNAPLVRCDVAAWEMFGISMAGYNILYALLLAALTFVGVRRSLTAAK